MPISMWTRDQVPELQMAGAQGMGAGIGGGLDRISNAIERIQERKKQEEDERKRVVTAAKASASLLKALSDDERAELGLPDPSTFAMLDPQSQVGTVTGAMQAFGAKKLIGDRRQNMAENLARQQADRRRQEFNAQLLPQLQALGQPGVPEMQAFYEEGDYESQRPQRRVSPGVLTLEAAARAGALDPARLDPDALLRAAGETEAAGPLREEYIEDPQTGQRHVKFGRQLLPTGTNPNRPREPEAQYDENGVLLGHVIYTGGRAGVFQRAQLPTGLTAAQRLSALNGQYRALVQMPTAENKKQAQEVHAQIQKLMDADKGAGNGMAPAAPRPGQVMDGYRFKGGDPANPESWEAMR